MADAKIRITAQDDASRVLAGVRTSIEGVHHSAAALGSTLAAAAASLTFAAAAGFTRSLVNSLDALNDLKDATGATIENISALEDVAIRTGTSFDAVGTSLVKFNAALKSAKPGSDQAAAFEAIGLSVKELKALDPAEALRQVAVALAGFADDGNKARLAQELFGKSLREVAPFLKDLSEKGSLVAKVTTQQAEEAEKFNKQLFAMHKNLQDVGRSLAGPALIGMNGLIDKFREGSKAGEGFIVTLLRQTEIARLLGKSTPKFTGGASGTFDSAVNEQAQARLLRQGKLSVDFDGEGKVPATPRGSRAGGRKATEDITEAQRALASYVETLQRELEKNDELTASQKALNFLKYLGTDGQIPQVRELVLGMAEQVEKEKELARALELTRKAYEAETKALEDQGQARLAGIAALDQEINRLSGREGDDRKRSLTDRLAEQLRAGAIFSKDELDSIVRGIGGISQQLEKSRTLAEELGLTFTSAFEDAIVGGKKLSDLLRAMEQDILRIVTRKLVTEPLGNAITGILGGGGSGGLFGPFLSSIFGGARADGGPVLAGVPYMVGERGRELFVPQTSGSIVPTEQLKGNTTINHINVHPPAGMSRASGEQLAADIAQRLSRASSRNN